MNGLSVVIPFGGRPRLKLLDAVLRYLGGCVRVDQVVVSELGREAVATEVAARWGVDYIFTPDCGRFNKSCAMNNGARLSRHPDILWLDGDLVFGEQFLVRALDEFRAAGLDHLFPFSRIHYLREADTQAVLAGTAHPADCSPSWTLSPLSGGNPGAMGLVRRSFLEQYGGMIEDFAGWGGEDDAWVHKVSLLGRLGVTQRDDQDVWHLYHPDGGSNDSRSRRAALTLHQANVAQGHGVQAIGAADEFIRRYPPPRPAPPWPAESRIVFVVASDAADRGLAGLAADWSRRIGRMTGMSPPIVNAEPGALADAASTVGADAAVVFAGPAETEAVLASDVRRSGLVMVVPDAAPHLTGSRAPDWLACGWILARTAAARDTWRQTGLPVWHQPWDTAEAAGTNAPPTLVQAMSEILGRPRARAVRIALDRDALPPAALAQPKFWYVAFHDADGADIARQDANHRELHRLLSRPDAAVVIERQFMAVRRPMAWTVWLADRLGNWLQKLSGPVPHDAAPPV